MGWYRAVAMINKGKGESLSQGNNKSFMKNFIRLLNALKKWEYQCGDRWGSGCIK
jgi:hypothetical protein